MDNIDVKRIVIYKASSCLGTVFQEIALAYRIARQAGDVLFVAQSDADAKDWSVTRGEHALMSIPGIVAMQKADKYWKTQLRWMFADKFLIISGPGENAAQSKQVRFLHTDESHLQAFESGRLAEFEERMSKRWDRQSVHATTAPNAGKEIDVFFNEGNQDHWHHRCPKCQKLIWMLWEERSIEKYGMRVIHWEDKQSDTATLDSIKVICPHCENGIYEDKPRDRYELVLSGDYVAMNPDAAKETASLQWSCFAAHWMPWRDHLAKYLTARNAAKLGDLSGIEDFDKKRLCIPWTPRLVSFGKDLGKSDYCKADKWQVDDSVLILTSDYQAGKEGEGSHLWALATQWDANGNSRRLAYEKLSTFSKLREFQLELGIKSNNVCVDSGFDSRTVFRQCSIFQWYAARGSDDEHILHYVKTKNGTISYPMPYSQTERQNGNLGAKRTDKLGVNLSGPLPLGWCLQRVMCNPTLYAMREVLKNGSAGRYFGIASDIGDDYTKQANSWIQVKQTNKITNIEKVFWKKVAPDDHAHDCEVMALMMAMVAGYYPVAKRETETTN